MKVLLVHSSAGLYGADRCLLAIVKGLISQGSEAHVVVPEDGELVTLLKSAGAKVLFIDPIVFRRETLTFTGALKLVFCAPLSIWKLSRLMRHEKYDLVHTNTSVTIGGAVAARICRIPHVMHFREILTEFGPLLRLYEPLINLLTIRLIFITQAVGNQFSSEKLRQKGKVVHDGIPVHDFDQTGPEATGDKVVITSVGRLAPYKGQDVLVRALAQASAMGVELEAYFVGDVYANRYEYKESLLALTHDLGMNGKIHFVGFQENIQTFLERCNIFVLSSIRDEGLGIVMLEAMAANRAVIATNGGGVSEIIKGGENGILVEPGNSNKMAEAIIRLANDSIERRTLADRGHEIACEKFSDEAMFSSILGLYKDILDEVQGRSISNTEGKLN